VQQVYQNEQDSEHGRERSPDHEDPSDVANDVRIFLGGTGGKKAGGTAAPLIRKPRGLPASGPASLDGSFLGHDLVFEFCGAGFLVDR
jgi:hypothetical protein